MNRRPVPFYRQLAYGNFFLLFIWLLIGFAIGTLILLFPLRSWVDYVRENHLSSTKEKTGVLFMIVFLTVSSFYISKKLFKWQKARKQAGITLLAFMLPLISAGAALFLFMNPNLVNKGAKSNSVSKHFTIGPYPTAEKIEELRKDGFTGIISLLHPAVVPFEPALLADEEKESLKNKIQLIKAPMLPWVSDNSESLKMIEQIARTGKGKYYVHCYLGKDRVNVVKNLIIKLTGESAVNSLNVAAPRKLDDQKVFERGDIFKLAEGVYVTPFPTNEEVLAFFQTGVVKTVVNIMDSSVKENKTWISDEHKQLRASGTPLKNLPVTTTATAEYLSALVDSINSYPKPVVIHHWNTTCPESVLMRKAFRNKTAKATINLKTNVAETN